MALGMLAATWDGYTAGSVAAGSVTILTAFLPRRSLAMRFISLVVGVGAVAYGIYVANQTSGTFTFPTLIFTLPILALVEAARSQRGRGNGQNAAAAGPVPVRRVSRVDLAGPDGRSKLAAQVVVGWFAVDLLGRILIFNVGGFDFAALSFGFWQRFTEGSSAQYRPMLLPIWNNDLAFHLLFIAAVGVLATRVATQRQLLVRVAAVLSIAAAVNVFGCALKLLLDGLYDDWRFDVAFVLAGASAAASLGLFLSAALAQRPAAVPA